MLIVLPNSSHEVGQDRQSSNTETTEGGSGGNVSVELMNHGGLSVSSHHHLQYNVLTPNLL